MATTDFESKYKAGFTNSATKKEFVKHTPFRFVFSNAMQQASLGFKKQSYPTPINPGSDGKSK